MSSKLQFSKGSSSNTFEVSKAGLLQVNLIVHHNLPFSLADHLSEIYRIYPIIFRRYTGYTRSSFEVIPEIPDHLSKIYRIYPIIFRSYTGNTRSSFEDIPDIPDHLSKIYRIHPIMFRDSKIVKSFSCVLLVLETGRIQLFMSYVNKEQYRD